MRVTADAPNDVQGPEFQRPARIMFVSGRDAPSAAALTQILVDEGHQVQACGPDSDLLARIAQQPPDLLVVDLDLPAADGLAVCRQLRARWQMPIVTLSPTACEDGGIASFEAGADGHIRMPCRPGDLVVRVRSLLRLARTAAGGLAVHGGMLADGGMIADGGVLVDGELRVDFGARQVSLGRAPVTLTTREFDLLAYLMRNPRRALSREQLLAAVWNWTFGDTSTVTVHVRRLRAKLENGHPESHRIVTVRGVGYRYEPSRRPA